MKPAVFVVNTGKIVNNTENECVKQRVRFVWESYGGMAAVPSR
jgi:hypothetical protein